jgi:hypothetical protein
MGGGLMQLVAYGAQDIYLTGNPQITFFKVVYRRHTNFSMETIEQTIDGTVTTSGSSTVTISRNGDLVYKVYVSNAGNTSTTTGSGIVSEVEIEIGGQMIDRHYEEWNQIWNELSTPASKQGGLKCMIGDVGTAGTLNGTGVVMTQYPLNFWFCRNPGLALPLIALQYHEVKLKFTWGSTAAKGVDSNVKVMCDYIYLDTDERRRFAQVSHEYLIEQVQKQAANGTASNKLIFNHPVKELIWTSVATSGYTTAQLKLNGHDRFSAQNAEYFQLRQPFDYHTSVPLTNLPTSHHFEGSYGDHALDVFTAQNSIGSTTDDTTIEAMNFANVAVTTGKVIVSQGGTSGALAGRTAAVTAGEAETAVTLIYSFLASDFFVLFSTSFAPVVGNIIAFEVGGVCSATNAVTADDTKTIVATVTKIVSGGLTGGLTNSANYHIQLDRSLCEPTLGAEIDGADDFTIKSMALLFPSHEQHRAIFSTDECSTSSFTKKMNVYSFALKPEEHQPSGTCNFSRIDTAILDFTGVNPTSSDNIYAVNYNVLRIMSGMGGLAYSN